jgi:hypothetical protein
VSETGERRDTPTRISALPAAERRVLAALAIVGRASLSGDELAELAEVHDVIPLVADLEWRELVRGEEKQRYRAIGRIGEEIRQTDTMLSTGERLLQYMTTLAKGGQLTPERLLDDAEAILGLTEWAAECQQWEQLLELVKTLQACFGIESRVEEWLTLLDRGHSAARALGDRQSEIWVLRQLAAALASTGDLPGARQRLTEADELEAGRTVSLRRVTLWTLGAIAFGMAGGAAGCAIGDSSAGAGPTTTVPVTVSAGGQTVTRFDTVTLPATTVLSTTTVTATVPPPQPPSSTTP